MGERTRRRWEPIDWISLVIVIGVLLLALIRGAQEEWVKTLIIGFSALVLGRRLRFNGHD